MHENGAQMRDVVKRHADFSIVKPETVIAALGENASVFQRAVLMSAEGILLTPRRTGMDGSYVSMLRS